MVEIVEAYVIWVNEWYEDVVIGLSSKWISDEGEQWTDRRSCGFNADYEEWSKLMWTKACMVSRSGQVVGAGGN